MKKLLLLSFFGIVFACRPRAPITPTQPAVNPSLPTQPSSTTSPTTTTYGSAGRYLVTAYIVAGDTLHTARQGFPVKSKLDIDSFAIVITQTGTDQYTLTYSYYHNPTGEVPTFTRKVTGSVLNDYYYRFMPTDARSGLVFDSKLSKVNKQFYQRTLGDGIVIPLKGSSAPLDQTTDKEVIIVAVPQR